MYEYNAKLIEVIDGDTVDLEIDLGFNVSVKERFRLNRINAPEKRGETKEAGLAATDWLKEQIGGGSHYRLIKQNESDRKADDAIRRLEEALSKSHGFKSGDWVLVIRTEDELISVHPVGSRRKIDEILDDTIAFVGHTLCLKVGYVIPCERPTYKPGDWVRVILCSERGIPTTEHPVGSKRCVKEVMSIRDRFVLKFEDRNFVRFLCCIDSEMVEPSEKPMSFEEMRTALREAGAKDWDNIEDPVQFLKELRGED